MNCFESIPCSVNQDMIILNTAPEQRRNGKRSDFNPIGSRIVGHFLISLSISGLFISIIVSVISLISF